MTNKRKYYVNNPSSETLRIPELRLSVIPGVSNLFDLNDVLTYEQINHSLQYGTLRAAIDNGLCYPVPDPYIHQQSLSNDILIRKPLHVQVLPSRARFTVVKSSEETIFTEIDDINLFDDDKIIPARELAEAMKNVPESLEKIEATIKEANITNKSFDGRYTPSPINVELEQNKIKNDIKMRYRTCAGFVANGKRCMREAKKNNDYCGLHLAQAKLNK